MEPPVSEDVARGRWMAINLVRIAGAAMVVVGLMMIQAVIPAPDWAGYVVLGAGLIDIFLAPLLLARKWRSPLE